MAHYGWKPYVPVAKRRANAARKVKRLAKTGKKIEPVEITGRKITHSFWGEAWCDHLEKFSDYENRLPRGRTYVRNGSVCHLGIGEGRIEAIVSGSELYDICINIQPLPANKWKLLRDRCTGKIGSLLELLQGRFSSQVMEVVTDREQGLFPKPDEIGMHCSCPDWATLCKHLAAVLYGVGARLDQHPELLFKLRGVDHGELISADLDISSATRGEGKRRRLASDDLSGLFGVEIDGAPESATMPPKRRQTRKKESTNQAVPVAVAAGDFIPSSDAVARLRKRFNMSRAEFARLVSVSAATIANWEKADRELRLQRKTLLALRNVADMTPEQAAYRLNNNKRRSGMG